MKKEDLLNIKPESFSKSDICRIFNSDPKFKKAYEQKWNKEIDCSDNV